MFFVIPSFVLCFLLDEASALESTIALRYLRSFLDCNTLCKEDFTDHGRESRRPELPVCVFSVVVIDLVAIFLIAITLLFVRFLLVCFLLLFFLLLCFLLLPLCLIDPLMHAESKWSLERFKCLN